MNELGIYIFDLVKLLGLGYLIGDFLELKIASLQRGRSSIISFVVIMILVLMLGMYIGNIKEQAIEFVKTYIPQTSALLIGLFMGLYREKVLRTRH